MEAGFVLCVFGFGVVVVVWVVVELLLWVGVVGGFGWGQSWCRLGSGFVEESEEFSLVGGGGRVRAGVQRWNERNQSTKADSAELSLLRWGSIR